jgi:ubiquitin-protein ligase E3 B
MPPPSDFELLRGKDARRGVSGETKHELLARASLERQVRADARRKKHGALTVQRIWRGRRVAASVRASVLASWDLEYGSSRVTPSLIELLDKLLPPLLMVGAQNAGAQRTLRGLALALGTCNAEMGTTDGRQKVQHWTQRARRLSAFALDVLCTASRTSAEDPCVASLANASRECAVRLLTALHGDGVLVRLDDPLGSKHHLTMCDVAASLAREGDRANAQSLVRITLNTMDTWEPAEPTETSDCTPLGLRHVALRFVAAVPSLHKAVDVHVFAKVMSSRAKVKAFLKAFYMGTEESAVPGTESTRSSDLSSHFDPVTAADNLVWLVTGWHVGCNGHTQITQARQKLVALDDETLVVFLEVLTSLTQTSNTASTPNSLREVWFVMGVFREGNEPEIDALAKLFWAAASTGTSSSSIDHNKDRRRILGAVAFAPGVLLQMWRRLAVRLPVAVSISDSPGGADGSGLWCSPTLALGAVSVSATDVPLLGLFSLAYGHLLSVLDDDEFFKTQNTFTLHTQIAIAACANTLVVRERLRRSSAGTRGSSSATQNHDHARLTAAVVSLLKGLVTRDARRKFTPPKFWLAPADATQIDKQRVTREIMKPLPPEAAASALMGLEATTRSGKQSSATNGTGGYTNFLADCPHALPFETRVKIFRLLVNADRAHLQIGAQSGGVDADRTNQGQRVVPVAKITYVCQAFPNQAAHCFTDFPESVITHHTHHERR